MAKTIIFGKLDFTNVNEEALKEAIEAVEENNRINNSQWGEWAGSEHIVETYAIDGLCEAGEQVLERAIFSNGKSLESDMPAVELAVWGQNFHGSFWNRADDEQ